MVPDPVVYPINEFGPLMKGLVIGGLGIFHVFLAQFAIGGGMLMCYFQWLAQTGRSPHARAFLDSYFRALVLVSFVVGAVTGVAMWFTTIQVSPATIGLMVDEFHWVWATEWTFFALEIVAGYAFYRCGQRLDDRSRMTLLVLYALAGWFSLFWINGILAWQLTPGNWLAAGQEGGGVWAGFFNPSFWPSLFYRTVSAMAIAALVACVVINTIPSLGRAARTALIGRASHFMVPMLLMPLLGAWYVASMPAESRAWIFGGNVTMTMFLNIAVGSTVLVGGYAILGLWRQHLLINGATATLLVVLAFAATAGGEFVREGVRKPYTVRETLYSNAIRPAEVAALRRTGSVTGDPWPVRDPDQYPNDQLRLGFRVYRAQCSVCHTVHGVNALPELTGTWETDQKRLNIAKLQHTKSFMPPFAGTPEELEALVQWLEWTEAGRPNRWNASRDPAVLASIRASLEAAGTAAGGSSSGGKEDQR
ncbi:MAG: cytochrome ubiquinol oxidase subunit I [Phycisphaerales bacterium]|nr:cytochrome ubiquinol oxidase subunit I [Phycisphaerales bacterium]